MLLIGAIVAGYVYFISQYLQRVLGFSPIATGLSFVPATATVVLTTTFGTRRLLQRFGVKATLLPASRSPPPASSGSRTSQRAEATS